jgi:ankyrin repeat protein
LVQVRLLLKHGADMNKEERKQRVAPIHIAADKGHAEVILSCNVRCRCCCRVSCLL